MKLGLRWILIATILYIYLPICIFLIGFTKLYVAIPTIIVIIYFGYKMYKDYYTNIKENKFVIRAWVIIVSLVLTISFTLIMGYGNLFEQPGDWLKHNAVIQDLVLKSWPVYYTEYDECMLTYYIGQYIIPSIIGKLFSIVRLAEILMAVWGVIGIYLAYLNLIRITKSDNDLKQIRTFFVMFFFCGALVLAQFVLKGIYENDMYCDWQKHWILAKGHMLQYRSNYVMLGWVYPQTIVSWLITILFFENRSKVNHYVLLFAPALLFGSFNIVAFAFLAVINVIYLLATNKFEKKYLKSLFSASNIVSFFTLGIILLTYFAGFMSSRKPGVLKLRLEEYDLSDIWVVVIFLFFMVGIYAICIFKETKDILFYSSLLGLCIVPFFTMGLHNDWVMCVSIPFLFVLMICTINFMNINLKNVNQSYRFGIITMCLIIGAWYPVVEMKENLVSKAKGFVYEEIDESLEKSTNLSDDNIAVDMKYNYYNYALDKDFFYNYIARKKIND